ncbi:hypothetical protein C8Q74DRAFT_949533 [Fomes fomentarius]|nr:hypothetical protein C8Q74DRAFT_949533 [Fomes fomentarius]
MFVFRFGRRICPDRHFGQASLCMFVASMLHVFDITPPLDEHGKPIAITPGTTDGMISCGLRWCLRSWIYRRYPEDVRCTIGRLRRKH